MPTISTENLEDMQYGDVAIAYRNDIIAHAERGELHPLASVSILHNKLMKSIIVDGGLLEGQVLVVNTKFGWLADNTIYSSVCYDRCCVPPGRI